MSLLRTMAARSCAVTIRLHFITMDCRRRLIRALLLLPGLFPGLALADGDLADMVLNVAKGAESGQTSSLTIAQFIGVVIFIGGILAFKKVGKQPGATLFAAIGAIIIGALLIIVPQIISRTQNQMGTSAVTVN